MNTNAATVAAVWRAERDKLLAAYPELAEDEAALVDTLDGETEALDVVRSLIRSGREDEATAEAVRTIRQDNMSREERFRNRADRKKQAALALMQAIGVRKVEAPDFTASITANPPKVVILDEAALPRSLGTESWSPDKRAIGAELIAGRDVPGAVLTNGGETLTRRFK